MKIRTGFVSNSSSSSFILMTTHPINTVDDVINHIFNVESASDTIGVDTRWTDKGDVNVDYTADDCASYLYHSMRRNSDGSPDVNKIFDDIRTRIRDGLTERNGSKLYTYSETKKVKSRIIQLCDVHVDFNKLSDEINTAIDVYMNDKDTTRSTWRIESLIFGWYTRKYVRAIYKAIVAKYKNVYVAEIGDDDGPTGSFLEHTYNWPNTVILRTSHH